ncbi:MAG: hypothetical protein AMS27_00290 [Bacteroides sp. SM23_62_1]|nr:MAG: hypothetical protein AMS27_00290 [Bacteroides sp. SM23_62_1]
MTVNFLYHANLAFEYIISPLVEYFKFINCGDKSGKGAVHDVAAGTVYAGQIHYMPCLLCNKSKYLSTVVIV